MTPNNPKRHRHAAVSPEKTIPAPIYPTPCRVKRVLSATLNLALLVWLCCAIGTPASYAQETGSGTITGRVSNPTANKFLQNARIRVSGTNIEVFTDSYGEYRLTNVPAGTATLEVFYTGFAPMTVPVKVESSQATNQDIALGGQSTAADGDVILVLSEYIVQAQRETDPSALAVNEQRFASNIKNVVSTDAFGAINQGNVGEFLKYVPGVTLEMKDGNNPSGIQVRGFSSNFTNVTLNGGQIASAAMANTTNHNRQFILENANINNISRIEVYKTPLPELPANALGGSVNLVMKSAFEYAKPELKYRLYLSMNGGEATTSKTTGPGEDESYKIRPSVDATYVLPVSRKFGAVVSFAQASQTYLQYQSTPAARYNGNGASATNPFIQSVSYRRSPNSTDRTSGSVKLDFRPWTNHVFEFSTGADAFKQTQATRQISFNVGNGSNVVPTSWSPTQTTGNTGSGASANIGGSYQTRNSLSRNVGSKYTFKNGLWEIDAQITYSHSNNKVRDKGQGFWNSLNTNLPGVARVSLTGYDAENGSVESAVAYNATGGIIDTTNLANYRMTRVASNEQDAEDTVTDMHINARRKLDFVPFNSSLKTGLSRIKRSREIDFAITEYTYLGPDGIADNADNSLDRFVDETAKDLSPGFGSPGMDWPSPWKIFQAFQQTPEWFTRFDFNNSVNRNAERSPFLVEYVTAGYLQSENQFFRNSLKLVGGVRMERTDNEGFGPRTPTGGGLKVYRGFFNKTHYQHFFPSANGTYNITDSLLLRVGFAKTIGRPNLYQIVPNVSVTPNPAIPEGGTVSASNPLLKPWTAKNYDVSIEYYMPKNGVISAGVFRKDIRNFFFNRTVIVTPEIASALNLGSDTIGYRYSTTYNIPQSSRINGVELNVRQPLGFLGQWGERFEIFGSLTKLDLDPPSREVAGAFSEFADKAINAGIRFGFWRFSGNLLMNHQGEKLRDVVNNFAVIDGTPVVGNEMIRARTQVDADLSYRINDLFSLFVAARNLNNAANEQEKSYAGAASYGFLSSHQKFGAQYSFGVQGSF